MLKLGDVRLVRFEPEVHSMQIYQWYYSGDHPEFYRNFPECPTMKELAAQLFGKTFMVFRESDRMILGKVVYYEQNEYSRNFGVGVLIDKKFEGQGYGSTAFKILLNWKFNYCNLYKAKMQVMVRNKRIRSILERLGATFEAPLKKEVFLEGKFHDIAVYAMFKTEFNEKYLKDFEPAERRLDAPMTGQDHVRRSAGTIEAVPGPTVWASGQCAQ